MTLSDDLRRENEALRERIAALHAAVLRISASLDVATVLQEVVESARALTGAGHGAIATIDETGELREFAVSGITFDEDDERSAQSRGLRLFAHLRDLPGPIRLDDLPAYVHSLGLSSELLRTKTFLGTPVRHGGRQVGSFFLGDKESAPEFTAEDEEVLVLFASQAAAAIANARVYRDEQRARADLEALVDTSPVGVVVFDASTGRPLSTNREANRIVEPLRTPGRPAEELLETLTCRFADGREVALDRFPIAQALRDAGTVRAEEIALSVADGRSVSMLVNATPIHAEDGSAVSVVVTLQDLAPLEEIERMRAEFLGMVGHELRTPLAAIKGSTATVLGASPKLDPAEVDQFFRVIDEQADHMRGLISDLLDAGRIDAGTLSVAPERCEVAELVEQARSTFLGSGRRHGVVVDLPAGLPPVLAEGRRIVQVLNNLLANAARHAPESSPIRVAAAREDVHVAVSVSDEGRGLTPEQLPRLFSKHASGGDGGATAEYGLGLAICKGLVEAHGGRIRAESAGADRGTTVTFTLPLAGEAGAGADVRPSGPERGEPARILAVDDDPNMLRFVRDALSEAGYAPLVSGGAEELGHIIRTEKPRLVLLDLILPGPDGIELLQHLPELSDLPVIFISAYGRDETVARALEAGAADYIVKPFSPTELVARVRAALRRHEEPEPFVLGALAIDYERRRVTVAGSEVHLTATEYELLRLLSLNAGRVVPHDTLLSRLWSEDDDPTAGRLRIFVGSLRRKLGDDAASPAWILNVRGVGYRMPEPGER